MPCRCGPFASQPLPESFVGVSLTECLLSSETTRLQGALELAQFAQAPLEFLLALRHLFGEGDSESESILKVLCLGIGDDPFDVKPLVVEQQPGERLDDPGLQFVACQRDQENLSRVSQGPGPLVVGEARVTEARELRFNPIVCGSMPRYRR